MTRIVVTLQAKVPGTDQYEQVSYLVCKSFEELEDSMTEIKKMEYAAEETERGWYWNS